jgi:hypothetical protein
VEDELFCTCSADAEGIFLERILILISEGCIFAHPPDAPVIKARRPLISLLTDIAFFESWRNV